MDIFRTDTQPAALATLANGLRAVVIPMPWRQTVSLSVFIRTGSLNETRRLNGISHVVEHMAFKGTALRDCQRINLDAERLGAEVNAHTDKDHTAFHIEGLARDLDRFVDLLADIVLNSTFPPTSWSVNAKSSCTSSPSSTKTRRRWPSSFSTAPATACTRPGSR